MKDFARHARRGDSRIVPHGFTLLEVLLAMAITALVAVMAYAGLNTAITAADRHGEQARRLGSLQTTMTWFGRDVRSAVDRGIDSADEREPALWGGENPALERASRGESRDNLLVLTRVGWDNPRGLRRGAIQRVRYRLDADNTLWRDHWLVLDRIDDEENLQSVKLLAGVKAATVSFLDGQSGDSQLAELGGEWMPGWPMSQRDTLLPLAVKLELDVDGIGAVTRIVGVAGDRQ
jgi:general secretion pathway protein J